MAGTRVGLSELLLDYLHHGALEGASEAIHLNLPLTDLRMPMVRELGVLGYACLREDAQNGTCTSFLTSAAMQELTFAQCISSPKP
eukprot:15430676-Alexandrium_andersonii.AAC.1